MRRKNTRNLIIVLLLFALLGLADSLYLVKTHYAPPLQGSFCDVGESVSCSLVNTSIYSEILKVPVAISGALWFLFLGLISWAALRRKELFTLLLAWCMIGILFVAYLIIAEIILQSLCLLCTLAHVLVLASLVISIVLFRSHPRYSRGKLRKPLTPWIAWIVLLNALPFVILNLAAWGGAAGGQDYEELAKCLNEKGMVMYGSFRCGVCAKTRNMFGDSFRHITEIECHPQGENSQWELCQEKSIAGTPTWVLQPAGQEIRRQTGFMSAEELAEFAGCEI